VGIGAKIARKGISAFNIYSAIDTAYDIGNMSYHLIVGISALSEFKERSERLNNWLKKYEKDVKKYDSPIQEKINLIQKRGGNIEAKKS